MSTLFKHHILLSTEPSLAAGFYGEVFSWWTEDLSTAEEASKLLLSDAGVVGAVLKRRHRPGHPPSGRWLPMLEADRPTELLRRAVDLGATEVMSPLPLHGLGEVGLLRDPQGAMLAIGRSDPDRPRGEHVPHFLWHELITSEPTEAARFYRSLVGLEAENRRTGSRLSYQVLTDRDVPQAGLVESRTGLHRPRHNAMWLSHIEHDHPDDVVERTRRLRGQVRFGPSGSSTLGRFALLVDPLGAVFGLIQTAEDRDRAYPSWTSAARASS